MKRLIRLLKPCIRSSRLCSDGKRRRHGHQCVGSIRSVVTTNASEATASSVVFPADIAIITVIEILYATGCIACISIGKSAIGRE